MSDVRLTAQQQKAILAFSTDFNNLNELECLGLWIHVSNEGNRRDLEKKLGFSVGSLNGRLSYAAAECYYYDKECMLRSLLGVIKLRSDTSLQSWQRDILMTFTNKLLTSGLISNIIQSISSGVQTLVSSASSETYLRKLTFFHRSLRYLADCLFFLSYQTQYEDSEVQKLEELLFSVCASVSGQRVTCKGVASADAQATGGVTGVDSMVVDLQSQLMPVFVVLQLTHMSALNMNATLLSRHCNAEPYFDESNDVTNALSLLSAARHELRADWSCPGAYGLMCLAYASLGHYQLENQIELHTPTSMADTNVPESVDERNPVVVQHYIVQAVRTRSFSYVRLCLLPILQSCFLTELDDAYSDCASGGIASCSLSFYMGIVEECVFKRAAEVLSAPMHLLEFQDQRHGFPFLPLSQQQYYRDELNYYREQQEQFEYNQQLLQAQREEEEEQEEYYGLHNRGKARREEQQYQAVTAADISPIDCQEDVMMAFSEYFRVRPGAVQGYIVRSNGVLTLCRFFGRLMSSISEDSSALTAPALNLLASMCSSQPSDTDFSSSEDGDEAGQDASMGGSSFGGSFHMNAGASMRSTTGADADGETSVPLVIFQLLRDRSNTGGKLDWSFLFLAIENYIQELDGTVRDQGVEFAGSQRGTPMKSFSAMMTPGIRTPLATPQFSMSTPVARAQAQNTPMGRKERQNTKKTLAVRDTDALLAIMELLTNIISAFTMLPKPGARASASKKQIMQCRASMEHLLMQYDPIAKLFSLLCNCSSSLPLQLKGKIFHTIAAFAYYAGVYNLASIQREIWQLIEIHGILLPSSSAAGSGHQGLRFELESVESVEGNYPVTDGFLTLLDFLITYATDANKDGASVTGDVGLYGGVSGGASGGADDDGAVSSPACMVLSAVGYGVRVPGINTYVQYVLEEVLYKSHLRFYSTSKFTASNARDNNVAVNYEGAAQRLKLVSKCLKIVVTVLQQYDLSVLEKVPPSAVQSEYLKQQQQQNSYFSKLENGLEYYDDGDVDAPHANTAEAQRLKRHQKLTKELLLDFNDNIIFDYPILSMNQRGVAPASAASATPRSASGASVNEPGLVQNIRPKSTGFLIMSNLLNYDDKLLYYLVQLLCEFNVATMQMNAGIGTSQTSITNYIASKRVSDLIHASFASQEIIKMQQQQRHGANAGVTSIGGLFNSSAAGGAGTANGSSDSTPSFLLPVFSDLLITQHSMMLDYTCMPSCYSSKYYTDINYWQQRIVTYAMGILYECSIRETVFLNLLQAQPVMVNRVSTLTPLNIQPLAMLLTSNSLFVNSCTPVINFTANGGKLPSKIAECGISPSSTALALLTSYLPLASSTSSHPLFCGNSTPTVPAMVVKLLQHVTTTIMNNYTPSQGVSMLQKLFGDHSENNISTAKVVINNFVRSLLTSPDPMLSTEGLEDSPSDQLLLPFIDRHNVDNAYFFHNFVAILTPTAKPYIGLMAAHSGRLQLVQSVYSLLCSSNCSPETEDEALGGMQLAVHDQDGLGSATPSGPPVAGVGMEQTHSLRVLMLQMLLVSLSSSNSSTIPSITLAHYLLLGVDTVNIVHEKFSHTSSTLSSTTSAAINHKYTQHLSAKNKQFCMNAPATCCLDVIIQYLNPADGSLSLLITHPEEALLCYEILFLLYKDVICGSFVFDLLQQPHILCTLQQLFTFADYSFLSSALTLQQDTYPMQLGQVPGGGAPLSTEKRHQNNSLRDVAHRNNCGAWLMKLISIEIHMFEAQNSGNNNILNITRGTISLSHYVQCLLGLILPPVVVTNGCLRNINVFNSDQGAGTAEDGRPAFTPDVKISPLFIVLQHLIRYDDVFRYEIPAVLANTTANSAVNFSLNEAQGEHSVWACTPSVYATDADSLNSLGLPLPVGFQVVDIEKFFAHYDSYTAANLPTSIGAMSVGALSKLNRSRSGLLNELVEWNLFNKAMASYTHLALSYKHLVDSLIFHCSDILLSKSVSSTALSSINVAPGSSGGPTQEGEVDSNGSMLYIIVESVILSSCRYPQLANEAMQLYPVGNTALVSGGEVGGGLMGSRLIEMSISEPLAQALYSMMFVIHSASANAGPADASGAISTDSHLSLSHYAELVESLIQLLLRSNDKTSSLPYRVSLYYSLLSLVQYATGKAPSGKDGRSTSADEATASGEREQLLQEYQHLLMAAVTPRLSALMEAICRDMTLTEANIRSSMASANDSGNYAVISPKVVRIVVVNVLGSLISVLLSNATESGGGTVAHLNRNTDAMIFAQTMKWFLQKRYAVSMLFTVLQETQETISDLQGARSIPSADRDALLLADLNQAQELFISAMGFCSKIALVPQEGLQSLLVSVPGASGASSPLLIAYIDSFLQLYALYAGQLGLSGNDPSSQYNLHHIWVSITGVFLTMLTAPSDSASATMILVVEGCCMLLRKYHQYVSDTLRTTCRLLAENRPLKPRSGGNSNSGADTADGVLPLEQCLYLSDQFIQLLTLIVTRLPCIEQLLNEVNGNRTDSAAGSGSNYKETPLFLIQWLNEFTVDVHQLLMLVLAGEGKAPDIIICFRW